MNSQQIPMQQPVSPTHPFTVTLEAQQWNSLLGALAEAPFKVAAPLVQSISQQLQDQAPQANGKDIVQTQYPSN